jgi:hypothetical protein
MSAEVEGHEMRGGETHREATERGRTEGRRDAKIEDHGNRLDAINGSIERTGGAVVRLETEIVGQRRDIKDLTRKVDEMVPKVAKLIAEGIGTKQVAEALSDRKTAEDSGGDRGRARIAWAVSIVTAALGVVVLIFTRAGLL